MSVLNDISGLWHAVMNLGLGTQISAVLYPYRKAYHDGRFSSGKPAGGKPAGGRRVRGSPLRGLQAVLGLGRDRDQDPPTSYTFPGRVLAHRWYTPDMGSPDCGWHSQQFLLTCENALVQLTVLAPDLVRVRVSPTGRFSTPFSYAIAKQEDEWPAGHRSTGPRAVIECSTEETEETFIIRTTKLHVHIAKAHLRLTWLDPDGTVIHADAAGTGWQDDKVYHWKHMPIDEHIYGLGEKTLPLDKRGLSTEMWNADPASYDPGDDPIYSNIPFYLGLNKGRGYGIFYDHTAWSRLDFGAETPGIARFEAETAPSPEAATAGDELRYFFMYGPKLGTVLERYTELTGRMAMPPLWALGYHQNRWSYTPEARVREVAAEFRQRRIPCEAIHLDIDYMDGFRCFTWDEERFPDPGQLIADLHAEGFKVVTMIDPGIKVDSDYWVCADGLEQDVFCKYPDGRPFSGPVWPGNCYFPDYTSARVRAWWGELYRGMVDLGVDGFWNDMNEPAVFGIGTTTFADAVQHEWEGRGAGHREAHNTYGMQMARATVQGLHKLRPDERPLVISRSVWAGSQRYNMHWLGDNRSDWPSLRNVMSLVLNMGLTGLAFTGPDTGGFTGTPDGELLARWNQMSAFMPFYRNHTAKGTGKQEPWALGAECERISRRYIELRYRLLPYHYTTFWQSAQGGIPIARPLFLAHQEEPYAWGLEDEYLYGDAFLVAPIVEPCSTSRSVYIPRGRWYDFWDDTLTAGPQIARLEAPLDRIPILIRAGSIVPAWPLMQHTGERPVDVLTLHVYPGNAGSTLYEDDGHTWAFQAGNYRLTRLRNETRWEQGSTQPLWMHVERATEGPFMTAYERIRVVLHGLTAAPGQVLVDGEPITCLTGSGMAYQAGGFDARAHLCPPEERTTLSRPPFVLETGLFHTIEIQM